MVQLLSFPPLCCPILLAHFTPTPNILTTIYTLTTNISSSTIAVR
jgi:hypothetical protein